MNTFHNICLIIILALIVYVFLTGRSRLIVKDEPGETSDNIKKSRIDMILSDRRLWYLVIAIVALTRLILFPTIPYGVNQDGVMGAVDAKALADYGTDRFGTHMPVHLYAWGYGQMSSFLSYASVPLIKIFGLNRFTLRFPTMFFSLLGIIAVTTIVIKTFGHRAGIIAGLFAAVCPWHFMQSRWALDCNIFPHMFVLGLCFLILGTGKKQFYYVSMIFFALSMYCYGVSFYMVPFFLLVSCVYLLVRKKIKVLDVLICLLVYFGLSWPEYTTMIINFFKLPTIKLPFLTIQLFEDSIRMGDIIFFSPEKGKQLISNLRSLINVVYLQRGDLIWNEIRGFGTVYLCSLPLIFIGLWRVIIGAFKEKKTRYALVFFFWALGIMTGLMINGINVNRINIIFYSHIILIAVAIDLLMSEIKQSAYIIAAVYLVSFVLFLNTYFTSWAEEAKGSFFYDFVNALEYSKELNADHVYITPDSQFDGSYLVSEILSLFVYDTDAEYYQGKTNSFDGKNIAYEDRFKIANMDDPCSMDKNTVYVMKVRDGEEGIMAIESAKNAGINVKEFGKYYAVLYK